MCSRRRLRKIGRNRVINASDRLLQDLGLDGDDAAELFAELSHRFGTNFQALQAHWERHFRAEPTLLDFVPGRSRGRQLEPITVAQVLRAVDRGEWLAADERT